MRRWIFGLGALVGTTALVMACSVGTDCDFGLCQGPVVGNAGDGGGDGPVISAACDLKKSPKESPACVDDGAGIFVDASKGKPDAKGTKLEPLATIASAISKAISTKHQRVYVCDGTYVESLKITSAVSIYGGFDCTWVVGAGGKPKVVPSKGTAIAVSSVKEQIVIQDIEAVGSSDPNVKGSSAIGALIAHSNVVFRNVSITAGPGQPGAKGLGRSNYMAAAAAGSNASGSTAGDRKTCTCADATTSTGGHGTEGTGTSVEDGKSQPPVLAANANSGASTATMCGPGTIGANGDPDGVGEPMASPGTIVETGWDIGRLGGTGKNGHPGQGGGGGGAKTTPQSAGGGGGCGGCGGAGGAAGFNGGASIAIVSFDSTLTLDASRVASGTGGQGGAGGDGQSGQPGGQGGVGAACDGGTGGIGAGGSGGSGGAGGDSIGLAWTGTIEPTVTASETQTGAGGAGGDPGGAGTGTGKPGNAGKKGLPGMPIPMYRQQ
jgi:hypothetical protein